MSIYLVDIEADGPCPGIYSMVSFGIVMASDVTKTFYGQVKPITDKWIPEALAVSGHTREEHLGFDSPIEVMTDFAKWLKDTSQGKPQFYSDNNGFDWQFINYYFHRYYGSNPFGFSSQNLGSLYKGMVKDTRKNFKHLRKTKHTHHPVDDSQGNVEALLAMQKMGLKIKL